MKEKLIITKRGYKEEEMYKTFSVRIKTEIVEQLEQIAAQTNRSRNELISIFLEYALKNTEIERE